MKKYQAILICLTFLFIKGYSQSNKYTQKQKSKYWDTESLYLAKNYPEAIEGFESLKAIDPEYGELHYLLGKSYFNLDNYEMAFKAFEQASSQIADANFMMAFIKLYNEELYEAKKYITQYEKLVDKEETEVPAYELKQLKANIKNAASFLENREIVNIINIGPSINTEEDEYVPLITSDEELLLFTSRRKKDNKQFDPYGEPFENVYFSTNFNNDYNWSKAQLIPGEVNTNGHDACVGLSPEGNRLYVFRTNENQIGGDLYESLNQNDKWSTPIRMSNTINNYESIEPSGSVSLDGDVFYFSSNREGGYGGFDLYRVKKLPNGEWSLPMNLGKGINTPLDEDAPFIHPDGKTLYFSSKGHKNMGGYDIFKSQLTEKGWTNPENLGYPTNSTKDDIYFTISANEKHGYYSSDKEGGFGGQDIYLIDYLEKELRQTVISARVFLNDSATAKVISLLEVESGELVGVYKSNPKTGKFIFLVNPNVEYELIIDEGEEIEEYSEIVQYTTDDLQRKQKKLIRLKKRTIR